MNPIKFQSWDHKRNTEPPFIYNLST